MCLRINRGSGSQAIVQCWREMSAVGVGLGSAGTAIATDLIEFRFLEEIARRGILYHLLI